MKKCITLFVISFTLLIGCSSHELSESKAKNAVMNIIAKDNRVSLVNWIGLVKVNENEMTARAVVLCNIGWVKQQPTVEFTFHKDSNGEWVLDKMRGTSGVITVGVSSWTDQSVFEKVNDLPDASSLVKKDNINIDDFQDSASSGPGFFLSRLNSDFEKKTYVFENNFSQIKMKVNGQDIILNKTQQADIQNGYYCEYFESGNYSIIVRLKDDLEVGNGNSNGYISVKTNNGSVEIPVVAFSFLGD